MGASLGAPAGSLRKLRLATQLSLPTPRLQPLKLAAKRSHPIKPLRPCRPSCLAPARARPQVRSGLLVLSAAIEASPFALCMFSSRPFHVSAWSGKWSGSVAIGDRPWAESGDCAHLAPSRPAWRSLTRACASVMSQTCYFGVAGTSDSLASTGSGASLCIGCLTGHCPWQWLFTGPRNAIDPELVASHCPSHNGFVIPIDLVLRPPFPLYSSFTFASLRLYLGLLEFLCGASRIFFIPPFTLLLPSRPVPSLVFPLSSNSSLVHCCAADSSIHIT